MNRADYAQPSYQEIPPAARDFINRATMEKHLRGICTKEIHGYAYSDEQSSVTMFHGRTPSGDELSGPLSYIDLQSESISGSSGEHSLHGIDSAFCTDREADSAIVQNRTTSDEERTAALRGWLTSDIDGASQFILRELYHFDASSPFCQATVFFAEDAVFTEASDHAKLVELLIGIALKLASSPEFVDDDLILSAIRRASTLLPCEQVHRLTPFLHYKGGMDARLAALQGILNVCKLESPANSASQLLKDRIYELASKLVDPDVLFPGQCTAILDASVCALVVLGDARASECASKVRAMKWSWLSRQIRRGLEDILNARKSRPSESEGLGLIEHTINSLA